MIKNERQNWITNIENTASEISDLVDSDILADISQKYGVRSLEGLSDRDLQNVFNELYAVKAALD